MKTLIQFKNFSGMEHIRNYVRSEITGTLERFESWRDFNVRMILGTEKSRTATGRPVFECELVLNSRDMKKPIFVKKTGLDFYRAIHRAIQATEKILRRRSRVRVSKRRLLPNPRQRSATPASLAA